MIGLPTLKFGLKTFSTSSEKNFFNIYIYIYRNYHDNPHIARILHLIHFELICLVLKKIKNMKFKHDNS